ncbi:MAG TPA: DUF4340 domain-containing protein [Alphaproteobacteria bacterium]
MKTNHLIVLAVVAALAVAGAVAVSLSTGPGAGNTPAAGERLFPTLAAQINDAQSVVIQRKDETVTLTKKDSVLMQGGWTVAEKYGYPAAFDKVRKLLVDLAELRPLEQKTSTPALFGELQLEDLSQPDAKSVLVTVKGPNGQDMLATYVGKERLARGGTANDAVYIRKANETQTWLAKGRLSLDKGPVNWLDRALADVARERVQKATVTQPDGTTITVSRAKPSDKDFTLAGVPKGKKAKSEYDVNQVAAPLEHLELDDVRPAADIAAPAKPGAAEIATFDGLVVRVDLLPGGDQTTWIRLQAKYEAPAAAAATDDEVKAGKLKSADEVKKEADALNTKSQAWVYKIPDWKLDTLRKKMPDLVEDEKRDEKKGS